MLTDVERKFLEDESGDRASPESPEKNMQVWKQSIYFV